MRWLDARPTSGNHIWVGHKEVARGDIFGNWKRFSYFCNGHQQYIYCRTQKVFLTLFAHYIYTLENIEGIDISTEDIIMDNPNSKPFRVKSWIWSQHGEYIQ